MTFYCTAGRGTEVFVEKEIIDVFGQDTKVVMLQWDIIWEFHICCNGRQS